MTRRRPGGQDRPEQNRAYDEAVETGKPLETEEAFETESLERGATGDELSEVDEGLDVPADPDERAERDAAREVRRRERMNR